MLRIRNSTREAFTLIEILVVLVIMGFLIAMVAPRLTGVVDTADRVTCEGNQERINKVFQVVANRKDQIVDMAINLLVQTPDGTMKVPSASDRDKENGIEFLSAEFVDRFSPKTYVINKKEALELRNYNAKTLYTMAKVSKTDAKAEDIVERNIKTTVDENTTVMMIGLGSSSSTGAVVPTKGNSVTVVDSYVTESDTQLSLNAATGRAGENGTYVRLEGGMKFARIILGLSRIADTKKGHTVENAGTCPEQIRNSDQYDWGNYLIVMPRLKATVERIGGIHDSDGNALKEQDETKAALSIIAFNAKVGESLTGHKIMGRTTEMVEAQSIKKVQVSCSCGHTWGGVSDVFAVALHR